MTHRPPVAASFQLAGKHRQVGNLPPPGTTPWRQVENLPENIGKLETCRHQERHRGGKFSTCRKTSASWKLAATRNDYDLNGNPTMPGYITGRGNHLSSDGTWTFSDEDEGNLTGKTKGAGLKIWANTYRLW